MGKKRRVKIRTKNPRETESVGEKIGRRLKPGDTVLLIGELGAGKSVLIKGIAKGVGIKDIVKSPSFIIIREFKGKHLFYHIDLYRVEPEEIEELGIFELIDKGIVCIEWGEKVLHLLRDVKKIVINIKKLGENLREIELDEAFSN